MSARIYKAKSNRLDGNPNSQDIYWNMMRGFLLLSILFPDMVGDDLNMLCAVESDGRNEMRDLRGRKRSRL